MSERKGAQKKGGGAAPWATPEQLKYLTSLRTMYTKSQAGGTRAEFWATVLEYWDDHWPIPTDATSNGNEGFDDDTHYDSDGTTAKGLKDATGVHVNGAKEGATAFTPRQQLTKV